MVNKQIFKFLNFIDVLFCYTFFVILVKFFIFIGLMAHNTHAIIAYTTAYNIIIKGPTYRMIFYCAFILIFLSFSFLLKNRLRLWYMIGLNLFISVLLVVDLWYLRGFEALPSLHILQQISNYRHMSESIFAMRSSIDLFFILDAIVLIIFAFIYKKAYSDKPRNPILFALIFIVAIVYPTIYIPHKYKLFEGNNASIVFSSTDSLSTCNNLSPLGYHIYSIYAYIKESRPYFLNTNDTNEIQKWFEGKKEKSSDNKYKALFEGKNLIMIEVESLENFVINQKINNQEITPNINKLLKNSLYFSNVHEQVNEGTTADAELLANTSVYPLRQGGTFFRYPYATYNSLPKLLKEKGYSSTAFHADYGSFWNWKLALSSMGFNKCIDRSYFTEDEVFGMGLSDESFFRQIEPMILKQERPFYDFVITLSNHTPFNLPDKSRELSLEKELDKSKMGGYLQGAHYSDKCLGMFIESLRKAGVFENTVIVIYGDHEGVHKYFKEDIDKLKPQQDWWLYNNKETPLIVYQEELQGEELKVTGGEIDILPTIAYLMGIDQKKYEDTAMGRNLLKTDKDFVVLTDGTCIGTSSDVEKENAVKGLNIAELIIKGDYFKGNIIP